MARVFHDAALSTKSWLECPSEHNDESREVIIGNATTSHRARRNCIVLVFELGYPHSKASLLRNSPTSYYKHTTSIIFISIMDVRSKLEVLISGVT